MDWRRLVQFALLGSSDFEQYAILLVRVSLGLFFAISGANKLFVAGGTQTMYETLLEAKIPFPHLMTYVVSGVEFVGFCCVWRLGCGGCKVVRLSYVLSESRACCGRRAWDGSGWGG